MHLDFTSQNVSALHPGYKRMRQYFLLVRTWLYYFLFKSLIQIEIYSSVPMKYASNFIFFQLVF